MYVCMILKELSKKQNELHAYFKQEFNEDLLKEFENMQNKYVLNDKYKIDITEVKNILNEIIKKEF